MKKTLKWNIAQKAELQWWENYLKGKDVEQYLDWKKNYWSDILNEIEDVCPITEQLDVLDVGCGPAGIFMNLQHCKTDALDPLLEQYHKQIPHFKKEQYPTVTFFSMPLEKFSSENKYDLVFCMNAINHVSDLKLSYDLLATYVKPSGKIIITIDAHNFLFFKYLFRLVPGDILHPHQYDLKEYEAFLTKRDFEMLKIKKLKEEFFFDHYVQVALKK